MVPTCNPGLTYSSQVVPEAVQYVGTAVRCRPYLSDHPVCWLEQQLQDLFHQRYLHLYLSDPANPLNGLTMNCLYPTKRQTDHTNQMNHSRMRHHHHEVGQQFDDSDPRDRNRMIQPSVIPTSQSITRQWVPSPGTLVPYIVCCCQSSIFKADPFFICTGMVNPACR